MTTWDIISIFLILILFLSGFVPLVMGIVYYARENRRMDREEKEKEEAKAAANAH